MKWLHNLLKGISLTGALFVFQACYGSPQDPMMVEGGEAPMTFTLVSSATGEPIEGINISSAPGQNTELRLVGTTGADGSCRVSLDYRRSIEGPYVRFEDPGGVYASKDTTLADLYDHNIKVKLFPKL